MSRRLSIPTNMSEMTRMTKIKILLGYENAILYLFKNNKIPMQDAKTVLWILLAALYFDELVQVMMIGG